MPVMIVTKVILKMSDNNHNDNCNIGYVKKMIVTIIMIMVIEQIIMMISINTLIVVVMKLVIKNSIKLQNSMGLMSQPIISLTSPKLWHYLNTF